jgi:hypothetical protein
MLLNQEKIGCAEQFFSVITPDEWNMVLEEIKKARKAGHFKRLLNRTGAVNGSMVDAGRRWYRTNQQWTRTNGFHNGPRWPDGGILTVSPSSIQF